jgi:predicted HTH domain antitoxin/antitoxin (DNA-binding transcriptional repressor) of toxin-antitoxin stability system
MIQTMKSDEVRNSFRDVLDAVQNGSTVVIERYNKSVGVLLPIEKWQSYAMIEAAMAEANEAKARRARGEVGLTSSAEMNRKVLELTQSLSADDLRWLIERLHQFAQDDQLPEKLTLEEAIHFYQTDQCSLSKAAELAGITRWQLQEILYQRGTPGTLGSDLTLDEIDDMVDLLEVEYAGRQ